MLRTLINRAFVALSLLLVVGCAAVVDPSSVASPVLPGNRTGVTVGRSSAALPAATLDSVRYVGVVGVEQSKPVDDLVGIRNADQYGEDLRKSLRDRVSGFVGVTGEVELQIRNGADLIWRRPVTLESGTNTVPVPPGTRIPVNASLCVVVPWRIAQQRVRPDFLTDGQYGMCLSGQTLHRFLITEGRGRQPTGAMRVVFIKSRG